MFQTEVLENQKTHFKFSKLCFFPKIMPFFKDNVEKNMVKPDRPQMAV